MSGGTVTKLAKPQLRRHFHDYLNRTFLYSGIASALSGVAYYYFCILAHRKRREDLYRDFDPEKEFIRLRDLGFYQCIPPSDPAKAPYAYFKPAD